MKNGDQKIILPSIYPVACHTDNIGPGSTFVAIHGAKQNGAQYIEQALKKGATTIVVQEKFLTEQIVQSIADYGAQIVYTENPRQSLAEMSAAAHNYPAQSLKIIGITGTKGKSTTAYVLEQMLRQAGLRTALTSSVKNSITGIPFAPGLTTPQPDYLHVFLAQCVQANVEYVVMEVAAQALTLARVHGIQFYRVLFTNFSSEHAEFYDSIDQYFDAKKHIFTQVSPEGVVILNSDDIRLASLLPSDLAIEHNRIKWFGDLRCKNAIEPSVSFSIDHSKITDVRFCVSIDGAVYPMVSKLAGIYNIYNIVGAATCALSLGVSMHVIREAVAMVDNVPGRLNRYGLPNGAAAYIDYAHTASSFEAIFSLMRPYTDRLIVIFGCGGERDVTKRPIMGSIAAHYADILVLTADNPRSEDPSDIIEDITSQMSDLEKNKVIIELDREAAIKYAYRISRSGSIMLILGKGVDEYQIIYNEKRYFSEAEILNAL